MGKNKKDKAVNYNAGRIVLDIVMLFLGLIFIIGTIAGKGDDIAAGFVRIIGGSLIVVGIFALINFLRIKEKMNRILSENTGKSYEQVCADTERDNFMSADEAMAYGLVDKVIAKKD